MEMSSYSLLCWGLRGLWALGGCCLCSCTEALFSSFASPAPQAAPLAQASALCRLSGQLHVHRPLFQGCLPTLPSRSPQAGALAAGSHYCAGRLHWNPQGTWQTLISSCWAPLRAPNLLLATHTLFSSLLPLTGWIVFLFFFLQLGFLVLFLSIRSFNVYLAPTVYEYRCSGQNTQILTWN